MDPPLFLRNHQAQYDQKMKENDRICLFILLQECQKCYAQCIYSSLEVSMHASYSSTSNHSHLISHFEYDFPGNILASRELCIWLIISIHSLEGSWKLHIRKRKERKAAAINRNIKAHKDSEMIKANLKLKVIND